MAGIKTSSIFLDDAFCGKDGKGMVLSADLENGASVTFPLDSKIGEPLFYEVLMNKGGKPQTDGNYVFWENGASLSVQEMLEIVQSKDV